MFLNLFVSLLCRSDIERYFSFVSELWKQIFDVSFAVFQICISKGIVHFVVVDWFAYFEKICEIVF